MFNGQHTHDSSRSVWVTRVWRSINMCWLHKQTNAWVNEWNSKLFKKKWNLIWLWRMDVIFVAEEYEKREMSSMGDGFHDDECWDRMKSGWRRWGRGALEGGRQGGSKEQILRYKAHMRQWDKYFMLACRYIIQVYKWWIGELNYNPVFNLLKQKIPPNMRNTEENGSTMKLVL